MHIFYTPDIENNEYYTLNEEESKHCVRVLRLKEGDSIQLIDGKGNLFEAAIADPDPRRCSVKITGIKKDYNKRNFYLHIAIAPTKNSDRFEWFLEKAVEIGIDEITPLICDHSERKVLKADRCEKVIIAAMKQSVIARKPVLNPLTSFEKLINGAKEKVKFIAHCEETEKLNIKNIYHPGDSAIILIGPEGDFSKEEIDLALQKYFQPITLGINRLRTETAGIVACERLNFLNE